MTELHTPQHHGAVLVVTDSTASVSQTLAKESGLAIVNLHVVRDGVTYTENVDVTADLCAQWLNSRETVTTSQPTQQAFDSLFSQAYERGYRHIVVVTLSAQLSGTYANAVSAGERAAAEVCVIDSKTSAMALGLAALRGASIAQSGAKVEDVVATIETALAYSHAYFLVDSLDFLRRGGRISAPVAAIGTVLGMKPILHMTDTGEIGLAQKVRTRPAALQALARYARESGAEQFGVHYFGSSHRAEKLAQQIRDELGATVHLTPVSVVLGAHVGPGLVALTYV